MLVHDYLGHHYLRNPSASGILRPQVVPYLTPSSPHLRHNPLVTLYWPLPISNTQYPANSFQNYVYYKYEAR